MFDKSYMSPRVLLGKLSPKQNLRWVLPGFLLRCQDPTRRSQILRWLEVGTCSTTRVRDCQASAMPTERTFLFSSESVNEGHPDRLCDQVSELDSQQGQHGDGCWRTQGDAGLAWP